jgi:hypothetical protein
MKISLSYAISALVLIAIGFLMLNGFLQTIIPFNSIDSEMFTAIGIFTLGVLFAIAAFKK